MPIETAIPVQVFDQESYHQIDRQVTGLAFAIHNDLGRYLDERLYQSELTRRCRGLGLEVEPEMRILIRFLDFSKEYHVDHLVNRGVVFEAKTVSSFTEAHRAQTLNYLFLCDLHHGTLLNFRSERVQHEFVSTSLNLAERRRFEILTRHWHPLTSQCLRLRELLHDLLQEWGSYLDPVLYREALTHFLGGEERVVREVSLYSEGELIGKQKIHLLSDQIAFSITASIHHPSSVLEHQRRFLRHTTLRAIHWINLHHRLIELQTILPS